LNIEIAIAMTYGMKKSFNVLPSCPFFAFIKVYPRKNAEKAAEATGCVRNSPAHPRIVIGSDPVVNPIIKRGGNIKEIDSPSAPRTYISTNLYGAKEYRIAPAQAAG
jgi:hypothetical protein